jgi:hypothetical protein
MPALGSMPVVRSEGWDLSGQIRWSVGLILLVSLPLWLGNEVEGRANTPSNKIALWCLHLKSSGSADRQPLADLGGEGRMHVVVLLLDAGVWWGKFQLPQFGACLLPLVGRGGEERRNFSSMCCSSGSRWSGTDVASPAGAISTAAVWILRQAYLLRPPPPTRGRSGEFEGGSALLVLAKNPRLQAAPDSSGVGSDFLEHHLGGG